MMGMLAYLCYTYKQNPELRVMLKELFDKFKDRVLELAERARF